MKTNFKIDVEWVEDNNPDLDWLGDYKNDRPSNEAYINRQHEIFVDPSITVYDEFDNEQDSIDRLYQLEDHLGMWALQFEENGKYFVEHYKYQELPFSCKYSYNSYEYYVSCNYAHPANDEEVGYFIQDFKILEDYGDGWSMRGCIVKASLNGVELGSASLWGLDSTMTEEEDNATVNDLTSQAVEEAKETLKSLIEEA